MSGSARWAKRGLAAAGGLAVAVVVGAVVLRRLSTSRFGPRQANTYLIVGLGDSVPAGTAAGGPDFLRILGETAHRETGRAFRVLNLAVPGLTVRGLMRQLRLPGVRQPVADADAVVVTIGANDFSWPLVRGRAGTWSKPSSRRCGTGSTECSGGWRTSGPAAPAASS